MKKKKMEEVVSSVEVKELMEEVIKRNLKEINENENLKDEERRKIVDETLKLSDKYNELSKNFIEEKKTDKIPEKNYTKVIEGIKAGTGIVTTGLQLIVFNSALGKVGMLEETGKWTTTAFRKLPWPKMFK